MSETEDTGFGEAWRPEPGDHLEGVVESIELIDPGGQGAYPCVQVREGDGSMRAVHAFHSVLRRELARRAPRIGDRISMTYIGKAEGGQYGGYHNYKVTGGQVREFNWESELPQEERARAQAEIPIAPAALPDDLGGPLVRQPVPSAAEKAEQFGEAPPF